MALTTYEDIKQEILDYRDWMTEDDIHQTADGYVPVYYNEIISEWQALPMEHTDTWQDFGISNDTSIFTLMGYDLFNYYYQLVHKAFHEIKEEQDNA
jgi:hypothetical protein